MERVVEIHVFLENPAADPFGNTFLDSDWWMATLEVHPWMYFVIGAVWLSSVVWLGWSCRRT